MIQGGRRKYPVSQTEIYTVLLPYISQSTKKGLNPAKIR